MNIKVIPTVYKGTLYRSRTEARWAVFFNEAGIPAIYEYEGFQTEHGKYLPDFFLPEVAPSVSREVGTAVEVKPLTFSGEEEKWKSCPFPLLLVRGAPGKWWSEESHREDDEGAGGNLYYPPEGYDYDYLFCRCPRCGKVGLEHGGRGERVCGINCYRLADKGYNFECFREAWRKALSFREWE